MVQRKALLKVIVALVFVTFSSQINAQQNETLRLSLEQAQQLAIERNRTLENAELDVQIAQATKWQSISSLLPQVSASADYSNMFGYMMSFGEMKIALPSSATMGVTAAVALNGAQVVGIAISEISRQMSDISLKKTEQTIANQVKTLYYSALVSKQTIDLLKSSLAEVEKLHNISQQSVDAGASEQVSADQMLVQVSTTKTTISGAERSLEMIFNALRLQLNLSPDSEIVLTDELDALIDTDLSMALLNEQFNIDNNYDYQLLKKNVDMAKKQLSMTQWSIAPTIRIAYQYSAKKTFGEGMNMTPPNTMNIGVSVPLFTSLQTAKKIKSAKLSYQKSMNSLADTENSLQVQYRQYCYDLKSAYEKYLNHEKNLEVNKRVFANMAAKYQQGYSSVLEMTNANTTLIGAQSSYVQSILELINAEIELNTLLNK